MAQRPTTKERDEARYMVLDGAVQSSAASKLVDAIATGLVGRRSSRNPTKPFKAAVAAILCDFLRAAETDPQPWSYCALRPAGFGGQRVGYTVFRRPSMRWGITRCWRSTKVTSNGRRDSTGRVRRCQHGQWPAGLDPLSGFST